MDSIIAGYVLHGSSTISLYRIQSNEEYGIDPSLEHYSAMVDLYGLSGKIKEAMQFIDIQGHFLCHKLHIVVNI